MAIEKGKDGFWLVDGKPVVVQTTRDEDGLEAHSANLTEDQLAELIESHTHVYVKNQLGEPVELSFDMDGETLVVKDVEALRAETIATLRQDAAEWDKTANRYPNALIANRLIVLDKHGRAFTRTVLPGEPGLHLDLPNADLLGVSHLSQEEASDAIAELARACPEAAPFVARDFQEYAREKRDESLRLIEEIEKASQGVQMGRLTAEQRDFIDVLRKETGLSQGEVLRLNEQVHELAAQHFVLAGMSVHGDGLNSRQDQAVAAIEKKIGAIFDGMKGVKDVRFFQDPRGTTVGINFELGAHNSLAGCYKVPLNQQRVGELVGENFWEAYPMETLYVSLNVNETGNAAFVDMGRDDEIARILDGAADKVEAQPGLWGMAFSLHDINGNRVGQVDVQQTLPDGKVSAGSVRLVIETGNAAFEDDANGAVACILREAASSVRSGRDSFPLNDSNGNVVGTYLYQAAPSLEHDGVIDMKKALAEGRVYLAEDSYSGIADGEYRFVVTGPDFEPGYGQGEGPVWLVNAKGEVASGYEEPQVVRENLFDTLKGVQLKALEDVVLGRVSFEEYERRMSGDEPGLP